uniref:Sucrose-6-phosphate hydrolase n=1 Tax=Acrobeloides nanus TaxID=290746 RepID=A0A914DF70_9BILA
MIFIVIFVGKTSAINVTNNRYRLNYHIMSPGGWINDPNGLSYFNGQYHVFFQYNPDSSSWGPMHWGHVVSTDLVHWKYLPIALYPDHSYDKDGCFSGSAIVNNGVLSLVYTGNVNNGSFDGGFYQIVNIATSTDGVNFQKFSGNPVIATWPVDGTNNFRDPKVWQNNGTFYVVLGNQSKDRHGRVVLYKSSDLKTWTYVGVLAEYNNDNTGTMWECPNFFSLGGKYALLFSPQGIERDGDRFGNLDVNGYFIGDYQYATNEFTHGPFYEIDLGHDFYAAQMFQAPDGRSILIGWMDMWGAQFPEQPDGWAGALTIPRELTLSADGTRINMSPIAELLTLRGNQYINSNIEVDGVYNTNIPLGSTEILLQIALVNVQARKVGLKFPLNNGELRVYYDKQTQKLVVSRKKVVRQVAINNISVLNLRIFVDRSSIEVFANNGSAVFTSRFYVDYIPNLSLFAEYGVANLSLQAFSLNKIW